MTDYKEITSYCGKKIKVSSEDYEMALRYTWYIGKTNGTEYPSTTEYNWPKKKTFMLHRKIMGFPKQHVDHINGDKLDCRRENLRLCTRSQNLANSKLRKNSTTGLKGVHHFKNGYNLKKPWRSAISVTIKSKRKFICLGYFKTKKEAAIAYDKAAKKYFGDFARLNFKE